jgi:hypothetical protein
MYNDCIDTIEYRECIIKIYPDNDAENPRSWDNLGTMVCFHRDYDLSDKHNFSDSQELLDYLKRNKTINLPLFLLDHSGLRMSTGDFFYCDPGQWDSGQVGIIYVDYEKIRKEYSVKHVTKSIKQKVCKVLESEVSTYDDYLSGNIYGFCAETAQGESIGACWGFFGDTAYMIDEAKSSIDYHIEQARKAHYNKLKNQIKQHVPFQYRIPLSI